MPDNARALVADLGDAFEGAGGGIRVAWLLEEALQIELTSKGQDARGEWVNWPLRAGSLQSRHWAARGSAAFGRPRERGS